MSDFELDVEILIPLVEDRSILWDKTTIFAYKERNETRKPWRRVCGGPKEGFEAP
jgi:hypothetical protein